MLQSVEQADSSGYKMILGFMRFQRGWQTFRNRTQTRNCSVSFFFFSVRLSELLGTSSLL